jgi:hypothetical protein
LVLCPLHSNSAEFTCARSRRVRFEELEAAQSHLSMLTRVMNGLSYEGVLGVSVAILAENARISVESQRPSTFIG